MTGPIVVLTAYALGCFCAGYYLTRRILGKDIRTLRSGNVGATNSGRLFGTKGFVAVFLVDFLKGVLAVRLAIGLGLENFWIYAAMFAVVLGHVFPAQLGFRGGKGIATFFGAVIAYDYRVVGIILLLFLPIYLLNKKFSSSGLTAFSLAPAVLFFTGFELSDTIAVFLLVILVLFAHWKKPAIEEQKEGDR